MNVPQLTTAKEDAPAPPRSPRGPTKARGDVNRILPISHDDLLRWRSLSVDEQIADNHARIDQHVVPYEQVLQKPMREGIAKKFTVIFMHIPKTGGTTLEYLLAKNYTINGVLHINAPALEDNPYALFKKGDLPHVVMGHHKMCHLLYRFVDRPLVHITMLRDPVRRVLSYFDYLQTSENHGLHKKAKDRTIEEFVDGKDMVELENAQTLRIAGRLKRHLIGGPDADAALREAKESLSKRFTLVGLTERYTEFLLMAQRTLGWRDLFHELRNVSKKKTRPEDVDPRILDRIRERNRCDVELYSFAQQLFQERCEQLGIDQSAVDRFHERNRRYQELIADES